MNAIIVQKMARNANCLVMLRVGENATPKVQNKVVIQYARRLHAIDQQSKGILVHGNLTQLVVENVNDLRMKKAKDVIAYTIDIIAYIRNSKEKHVNGDPINAIVQRTPLYALLNLLIMVIITSYKENV